MPFSSSFAQNVCTEEPGSNTPPETYTPPPDPSTVIDSLIDTIETLTEALELIEDAIDYYESIGEEPVGNDPNDPNGYYTGNEVAEALEDATALQQQKLMDDIALADLALQGLGYP